VANARKLYESERAAAEASLARADAEHASSAERGQSRVRELEEALKRAARDYKKLERDRVAVAANAAREGDALGAVKRENARLAHAASRLEDDAKRHKETAARFESDLAATRAALRKAEEEFAQRLARDRRAWEQAAASRGEYVEFDPYGDRGDRDGRPKRPPKGGRDENEAERRGDDPATIPLGDSPKRRDATDREMRPAGMSSAHLERVAMREKNKYAQRQRDLAMGVRAEYLVD
jgi:chromosome segregation ATPase